MDNYELEVFYTFLYVMMPVIRTLIIDLIIIIPIIVGTIKIFKKSGQKGWYAIIPIYNIYVLCKITGISAWWILIIFILRILVHIPIPILIYIIAALYYIACVYFYVILNISLSKAFQKNAAYAIGLIVFPIIFYPILGFSKKNQYVGINPVKEIIFGNKN